MNKLSQELETRGFIHQHTFSDILKLNESPITFYWGVDPSADSMTIGNLAPAMMIKHFLQHGHKAVLLVGGATGLIGDTDGKKQERELKDVNNIAQNKQAIVDQYNAIFDGLDFTVVDNYDWFAHIHYMDFLRDIGKHIPMSSMLDREFVKSRLGEQGSGISYAEFSYSLIQGYDFLHLFREHGVTLQLSGADQWGNCLSGVEMIRKLEGAEANVLTMPLIVNKTTGAKFGKSEDGAVWLDPQKTSVYEFYQWWRNVGDADVADYLKIFTMMPLEGIDALLAEFTGNEAARTAQKALAYEVTKTVHGTAQVDAAVAVTDVLFGNLSVDQLTNEQSEMLATQIPTTAAGDLSRILLTSGIASSNSEVRRLLSAGSVTVNGQKVAETCTVTAPSLIKKGKNTFVYVQ